MQLIGMLDSPYVRRIAISMKPMGMRFEHLHQDDVTIAVAWRFAQFVVADALDGARTPRLAAFSARAEALPEFLSTPLE